MSAPARRARSFSQTSDGATSPMPADVSNPQSVPAMIRRGSPTAVGDPFDAIGHDFWVLHVVARGVDDAGDECHVVGERFAGEARVLVGVAGVGHRDHQCTDVRAVEDREDRVERDVEGVRTLVVAPAHVQAHPSADRCR